VTTHRYAHTPLDTYQYLANNGAWRYLLPDGLGSMRGAVDTTGAFAESKHYTPYGELLLRVRDNTNY
jgi:hypothetical protein